MAANMHDVANLAGVSQRTVSNVVSGFVHVRPETRERVLRAIEELNYRPNPSARSMRRGRTGIIGLAVPYIAAPYFAELADYIQLMAAARGYTLLMDQTGADRERELLVLQGYRAHVIDGLIFSPMAITIEDLDRQRLDMPAVLLGERIHNGSLTNVAIDNVVAALEATRHLIASGRRRIAAVGADMTTNNAGPALERFRGYSLAHEQAGLELAPELAVVTGGWTRSSGYAAVDALVRSGSTFDALFCFNDVLALSAIRALADHGLSVPDDVSVVGWDDIEEAAYGIPSLTTVSPDKAAIAAAAVDGLVAQIDGGSAAPVEVVCEHRLVVRESTTAGRQPARTDAVADAGIPSG